MTVVKKKRNQNLRAPATKSGANPTNAIIGNSKPNHGQRKTKERVDKQKTDPKGEFKEGSTDTPFMVFSIGENSKKQVSWHWN